MPVASTTATGKLVIVTGFKELDKKLRSLPAAAQRKFVKGGLRKGAKRINEAYKSNIKRDAYDTGALYQTATKQKALKRSRTRVGVSTFIDTGKLYGTYFVRHGHLPGSLAGKKPNPFFYPQVIEFGDEHHEPKKPMRRALYDNEKALRAFFEADIKQFIEDNKVTLKL